MEIIYVCKYAFKKDNAPLCNGNICSDECKYTTDPGKALYQEHNDFIIKNESKWEVIRE